MRTLRIWAGGLLSAAVAVALILGVFRGRAASPHSGRKPSVLAGAGPLQGACKLDETEPKPSPNALVDVRFVSGSTGWVLGTDRILMTSDAGTHWTLQAISRTPSWSALDFATASHGWVIGTNGLQVTTDGGRHWRALPQTCPAIRALDFISPRQGFAIASRQAGPVGAVWGTRGAVLLVSNNGGSSWHRLTTSRIQVSR
jgi:photosystem II stability/assembly factor-like uncharacterized protein